MKILTREEEEAHYNATLKGGSIGGLAGLGIGIAGVYGATLRFPAFRQLTLPLRAFIVTSSTTFGAIVAADHYSRAFEASTRPEEGYQDASTRALAEKRAQATPYEKFMAWGKENRYPIVAGSWVLSMGVALGLVGRNPYLSTSQKLVQARVYAQSLTVAVLLASAAFEIGDRGAGEGRWETIKIVDPNDPEHKHLIEKKVHRESYAGEDQWRDMVESEEERMKQRDDAVKEQERKDEASGKFKPRRKDHDKNEKGDGKTEKKSDEGDKSQDPAEREKRRAQAHQHESYKGHETEAERGNEEGTKASKGIPTKRHG